MKKLILLITASIFISCSTDDSSQTTDLSTIDLNIHRVSKMVMTTNNTNSSNTIINKYIYNTNNLVEQHIIEDNSTHLYSYNNNGLMTSSRFYDINNVLLISYNYTYDNLGNLSSLELLNHSLGINNTLFITYIDAYTVEIESIKTKDSATKNINYTLAFNSNKNLENIKAFESSMNSQIMNLSFQYNQNNTVSSMNGINFEWDNKMNPFYNFNTNFYTNMPNGISFNDFFDLLDDSNSMDPMTPPSINYLGNGINSYTKYFNDEYNYTYNQLDLVSTMDLANNSIPLDVIYNYEFELINN